MSRQQPDGQRTQQPRTAQGQPQQPANRSPTDILGKESGKRFLKYIVGVFIAVGVGYGIGLVLLDVLGDDNSQFIGVIALFVPVFGAPIISMTTGLLTGLRLETDERSAAVASAVGAFIGFVLMLFLLLVFAAIVSNDGGGSSGGSDGGLSDFFIPLFGFGVGVAVTGAGTTFVVKRIGI